MKFYELFNILCQIQFIFLRHWCCVRFERPGLVSGGLRSWFLFLHVQQSQLAPGQPHHWPGNSLCSLQGGGGDQEGGRGVGKVVLIFKD